MGTLEDIVNTGIHQNNLFYVKFAVNNGLNVTVHMGNDAAHLKKDDILRVLYDDGGLRFPPEHTFTYISDACRAFLDERGFNVRETKQIST